MNVIKFKVNDEVDFCHVGAAGAVVSYVLRNVKNERRCATVSNCKGNCGSKVIESTHLSFRSSQRHFTCTYSLWISFNVGTRDRNCYLRPQDVETVAKLLQSHTRRYSSLAAARHVDPFRKCRVLDTN